MISTFIFDLDGTLIQTEIIKAHSYAKAVLELKLNKIRKHDVIEEYKKLVGRSREEVAKSLIDKFNLNEELEKRAGNFSVSESWQVLVKVRFKFYCEFLANSRFLKEVECPYAISLLKKVRQQKFKTALATASHSDEASIVLETLGIKNLFDFIATRELVNNSKPDPEIYNLIFSKLKVQSSECIVIEDSLAGINAAFNAGANCIAVPNDYTREDVNESNLIDSKWIVNNIKNLDSVAEEMIKANS